MVKMHEERRFEKCFKCDGHGVEKTPKKQKILQKLSGV